MRLLEERKDYILYYLIYNCCETKTLEVTLIDNYNCMYIAHAYGEIKNLQKDLKILSNNVIKQWKRSVK